MTQLYTTKSSEETQRIGKDIASKLNGGDIVLLHGELGAGKTTLVKGIAEGLGIRDDIVSPTFTLMNVYEIQKLVHIDTYRLKDEQELIDIGAEDYIGAPDTICVIEWPEKLHTLLKNKKTINVWLDSIGEDKRMIRIT